MGDKGDAGNLFFKLQPKFAIKLSFLFCFREKPTRQILLYTILILCVMEIFHCSNVTKSSCRNVRRCRRRTGYQRRVQNMEEEHSIPI